MFHAATAPAPESSRLRFIPLDRAGSEPFHRLVVDPHIRRYLLDGEEMSESWARAEAQSSNARFAAGELGLWLIAPGHDTRADPIGFAGFRIFPTLSPEPQLIYALSPTWCGRGLGTEAARACLELAWSLRGRHPILASLDAENLRSAALLERLGGVRVGITDDGDFGGTWFYRLGLDARLDVDRTWDGRPVTAGERAAVELAFGPEGVRLSIDAPWHGDAAPDGPGGRTPGLWNHEVVECFLLGDDERYLELELGPHGHYLALQLHGQRTLVTDALTMAPAVERHGDRWQATVDVPFDWLPPGLDRANAFAIHGSGDDRRYLAATPVPGDAPDFHRLDAFAALADVAREPLAPG